MERRVYAPQRQYTEVEELKKVVRGVWGSFSHELFNKLYIGI